MTGPAGGLGPTGATGIGILPLGIERGAGVYYAQDQGATGPSPIVRVTVPGTQVELVQIIDQSHVFDVTFPPGTFSPNAPLAGASVNTFVTNDGITAGVAIGPEYTAAADGSFLIRLVAGPASGWLRLLEVYLPITP